MPARFARFTQTDAKRLFKAAANVGINVRLEFRPDGTIVAITSGMAPSGTTDGAETDLDRWMNKHHADPT
jgi:hypothetical protein